MTRRTTRRAGPSQPNRAQSSTTVRGRKWTVAQFCAEWNISRSTFYDWRAKGRAPRCIKIPNGDLRIEHDDYEAWLARCRESA